MFVDQATRRCTIGRARGWRGSKAIGLIRPFDIQERVDFRPVFRYEKYRTEFQQPRRAGAVVLDETPIGAFVELEGPAEAIDRAAMELGFSRNDYVLKNYLVLYMEECRRRGAQPSHMLFPAAKSHLK